MSATEIKPEANAIESLLRTVETLPPEQFDDFYEQVTRIRERLAHSPNPAREAELLRGINRRLPEKTLRRRLHLLKKMRADKITSPELTELRELNEQAELDQAHRLELVLELAQLRKVAFDTLLRELGLVNTKVLV